MHKNLILIVAWGFGSHVLPIRGVAFHGRAACQGPEAGTLLRAASLRRMEPTMPGPRIHIHHQEGGQPKQKPPKAQAF